MGQMLPTELAKALKKRGADVELLWVLPQCMPGDIARLSEGVPDPTPLAPSYLDMDSFLFSSCPQFFIPYDLWPVDVLRHLLTKDCSLLEVAYSTLHVSEPYRRTDFTFAP